MALQLGPILYIGNCDAHHWVFHIQVLVDRSSSRTAEIRSSSPDLTIEDKAVVAAYLKPDWEYLRWTVKAKRESAERLISYEVEVDGSITEIKGLRVPAQETLPRLTFFSCNGFSSTAAMKRVDVADALWTKLRSIQESSDADVARSAVHLMVGGGDQIYADSLFATQNDMKDLWDLSVSERKKKNVSIHWEGRIQRAYAELYVERWKKQKDFAWMQARVPGIYTWDDHDIFDGWGSYEDDLNDCDAYQAIFRSAKTAFETFQLGGRPDGRSLHSISSGQHLAQGLSFEGPGQVLDFLLLDLRTDRKFNRVLSEQQWADINIWLAQRAELLSNLRANGTDVKRHLCVVASIPLVHMRFRFGEALIRLIPGDQELEDDLRDQWESSAHLGERDRMLMTLLAHSKKSESTVTLLSGDVHIGARGRVRSQQPRHCRPQQNENHIEQLTSSGIVHPAPSSLESFGIRLLGAEDEKEIAAGVWAGLGDAPGKGRYIEERNYLTLAFDRAPNFRLWAQWHTCNQSLEPQVVLEP